MADSTCTDCGGDLQLPTGNTANPNFAGIPSCPTCQPKRFDTKSKAKAPERIGAAEVVRSQVQAGLDTRRTQRKGLGQCNKCKEQKKLVTIQNRSDSNIQSDLTSTDVGPTKQVAACPSCDESLFKNEPAILGTAPEADPENVKTKPNALSAHYKATGQIHPALATIADLVEHQKRNPGAFSWHFEDQACDRGCRSIEHRLADPANAGLNLPGFTGLTHKRAVVHMDLRTAEQRDPNSRNYNPTPMWVKDTTYGRFAQPDAVKNIVEARDYPHGTIKTQSSDTPWKTPARNNRQTIGLSTDSFMGDVIPGGDKQILAEAQEATGSTEATLQAGAHERGAHEGRSIAACPTCNPNGGQSTQSAGIHNALHDAGLHKKSVDGCPQCQSSAASNGESKESRFLEQHRLGLHSDNSELFSGSGCPACQSASASNDGLSNDELRESRVLAHKVGLHRDEPEFYRDRGCPECQKPEEQ